MRALVLGPERDRLAPVLGDALIADLERPCTVDDVAATGAEALVSYRYRHLVAPEVLDAVGGVAVNLHVSLLPWNRGADPNLWSWLEHTPKGVSVHWMVAGLDRGDLLGQQAVALDPDSTLRSTYDRLQDEVLALFAALWPAVVAGTAPRRPQAPGGSYHRAADKEAHRSALPDGWDTRCAAVEDYGRRHGLWLG